MLSLPCRRRATSWPEFRDQINIHQRINCCMLVEDRCPPGDNKLVVAPRPRPGANARCGWGPGAIEPRAITSFCQSARAHSGLARLAKSVAHNGTRKHTHPHSTKASRRLLSGAASSPLYPAVRSAWGNDYYDVTSSRKRPCLPDLKDQVMLSSRQS